MANVHKEAIETLIAFIDVTAKRGGIYGEELFSIGRVRNELVNSLKQSEAETTIPKMKMSTK
jgi:hypothetical protein